MAETILLGTILTDEFFLIINRLDTPQVDKVLTVGALDLKPGNSPEREPTFAVATFRLQLFLLCRSANPECWMSGIERLSWW